VCANPQVKMVDALLGTGGSLREVSRITGIPKSTLSRHKAHARLTPSKLALIRTADVPTGPGGPLDPLAEALALSKRASTDRELLKAAEAVRSATALQVRALRGGDLDAAMLEKLDANIVEAAELYRRVGGFENELRGLAGHREAIRLRLEAVRAPRVLDVPVVVTMVDGTPMPGEQASCRLTHEQYFAGVPSRYRDADRFVVRRKVELLWSSYGRETVQVLKVYEVETGALVWSQKEGR
jgi:hypothetical protein